VKTTGEIRLKNLNELRSKFRFQNEFAAHINKAPAQVTQWLSEFRSIGHKAAREIEAALGKPVGWLDNDHSPDAIVAARPASTSPTTPASVSLHLSTEEAELIQRYRHCSEEGRTLILGALRAIAQKPRKAFPAVRTKRSTERENRL